MLCVLEHLEVWPLVYYTVHMLKRNEFPRGLNIYIISFTWKGIGQSTDATLKPSPKISFSFLNPSIFKYTTCKIIQTVSLSNILKLQCPWALWSLTNPNNCNWRHKRPLGPVKPRIPSSFIFILIDMYIHPHTVGTLTAKDIHAYTHMIWISFY